MENIQETTHPTPEEVTPAVATEPEPPRWLVITLQTLAYGIPLSFLAYVLYINYLPFGYNKTFTIDVGSVGDTDSSQVFYLEPSQDLSERKVSPDGTTYRELNGIATAVFKPNVVLEDAEITVEVEGEGVSIIPPVIDFDPESVEWDYEWDFTKGKTPEELGLINTQGEAFPFDGAMYFDGLSRLELPDSANKFEDGPFSVYVEWTPEETENRQQIVGHFNWELFQSENSIELQVGRMTNSSKILSIVKKDLDTQINNPIYSALIIYNPDENGFGYISLFVNNKYSGSVNIHDDTINKNYGDQNLTLGWSSHNFGNHPKLNGSVYRLFFTKNALATKTKADYETNTLFLRKSAEYSKILDIKLNAAQ